MVMQVSYSEKASSETIRRSGLLTKYYIDDGGLVSHIFHIAVSGISRSDRKDKIVGHYIHLTSGSRKRAFDIVPSRRLLRVGQQLQHFRPCPPAHARRPPHPSFLNSQTKEKTAIIVTLIRCSYKTDLTSFESTFRLYKRMYLPYKLELRYLEGGLKFCEFLQQRHHGSLLERLCLRDLVFT